MYGASQWGGGRAVTVPCRPEQAGASAVRAQQMDLVAASGAATRSFMTEVQAQNIATTRPGASSAVRVLLMLVLGIPSLPLRLSDSCSKTECHFFLNKKHFLRTERLS